MEPINVNLSCDIQQPVKVRYLDGYFFRKDSAGHRINVDVFDNGVPVSVGGSVSAEVVRSDGETVPVTGAVSENRAYVILPQAAYAVVGAVQITIKVTEGTTIVTIACFVAYVHESDTEIIVDPGTIIPSIQALISQIETAVASIPADYSSLWTSLAPAFSTSTAYAVGQYVTNSGVLYRFTTAHPAGTWNSAHVTAVNLGAEVSNLKSALDNMGFTYIPYGDSTFTISDMPPLSYSYVAATRFTDPPADDLASGTYCAIVSFPGSAISGVPNNIHSILLYSTLDKRIFHGWKAQTSAPIVWTELTTMDEVASLLNAVDRKTDFVRRNIFHDAGTFSDVDQHGITYAWTNETTCHITGTADAQSFNNIIVSQSVLPGGIKVGDVLHLHVDAPSGCGVRVYLYPNTLPNRDVFYKSDTLIRIPEGCIGMLVRLEVANGTEIAEGGADISTYLLSMPSDNDIGKFFYQEESVKILVFGSSFSYSTLGYLPEILEEIAPGIRVTLGICYDSGQTIIGHITNFDNNTKYTEYSEYDPAVGKWTNLAATITGKGALSRHKWDYVVIQQACRSVTDTMSGSTVTRTAEQNYQDIATFAEKITGYIGYPTSFLFNMVQALGANSTFPASYTQATAKEKSDAMMLNIAAYAERAMNDCIISDVLPCGTAIQNMRTDSSTDSIGTTGYMTCDNNGHLQNGIGVLVAGYAAAYKVMELIGKKQKMFGIQLTPTDALLAEWDLYTKTSHKTCVGVTDGNKLLGQKCALMANKKPFEITDFGS